MGVEKRKGEEGVATVVEQGVHTLMGGIHRWRGFCSLSRRASILFQPLSST